MHALEARALDKRLRVLIRANRVLNALCVMLGVPTLYITSRTEQSERDRAVRRFSEPSSAYIVMITSTMLNAYGVDFHKACNIGLMLGEPVNTATAI